MKSSIEVGDQVQVRSDGSSSAAKKYAGKKGQVTMVGPGLDRTVVDVQIDDSDFETVTVFEEQDLSITERNR